MKTLPVALLVLLALVAGLFGVVDTASAVTQYVNVPASAFVLTGNTSYLSNFGAIEGDGANVVRAPVYFTHGVQICRLDMAVHDNDGSNDVTAVLVRKLFGPETSTPFGRVPQDIASVSSSGAEDALRVFGAIPTTGSDVKPAYMYWVEIRWSGGPIQVTGIRIFTQTNCPVM
jgi:hypothetical protein